MFQKYRERVTRATNRPRADNCDCLELTDEKSQSDLSRRDACNACICELPVKASGFRFALDARIVSSSREICILQIQTILTEESSRRAQSPPLRGLLWMPDTQRPAGWTGLFLSLWQGSRATGRWKGTHIGVSSARMFGLRLDDPNFSSVGDN